MLPVYLLAGAMTLMSCIMQIRDAGQPWWAIGVLALLISWGAASTEVLNK